jgi:GNAT superfamily N-acetyltransferase
MSDASHIHRAIQIEPHLPDLASFKRLRAETEWGVPNDSLIKLALENSLFGAIAINGSQTVGMIRIVGDGGLNLYIQDVIVAKSFRGDGIGRSLIQAAIQWMQETVDPSASVGLMAATGQSEFYETFGFIGRPGPGFGPGMQARNSDLRPK